MSRLSPGSFCINQHWLGVCIKHCLLVIGWRLQPMFGSPPLMFSRHRNLEPLGRWHAAVYKLVSLSSHVVQLYSKLEGKFLSLCSASQGPIIDCYMLDLDLLPRPQPLTWKQAHWWQTVKSKQAQSLFDHDLWPMTLTYIARLAKVKVHLHEKDEGCRSKVSVESVLSGRTDRGMDEIYRIYYIPALLKLCGQ